MACVLVNVKALNVQLAAELSVTSAEPRMAKTIKRRLTTTSGQVDHVFPRESDLLRLKELKVSDH